MNLPAQFDPAQIGAAEHAERIALDFDRGQRRIARSRAVQQFEGQCSAADAQRTVQQSLGYPNPAAAERLAVTGFDRKLPPAEAQIAAQPQINFAALLRADQFAIEITQHPSCFTRKPHPADPPDRLTAQRSTSAELLRRRNLHQGRPDRAAHDAFEVMAAPTGEHAAVIGYPDRGAAINSALDPAAPAPAAARIGQRP